MADDFSKAPVSIAEIRSDRSSSAKDWTPRDVLVSLLRDIDSGKRSPSVLCVFHTAFDEDGTPKTGFSSSSPNIHMTLGLIEMGKAHILKGCYDQMDGRT